MQPHDVIAARCPICIKGIKIYHMRPSQSIAGGKRYLSAKVRKGVCTCKFSAVAYSDSRCLLEAACVVQGPTSLSVSYRQVPSFEILGAPDSSRRHMIGRTLSEEGESFAVSSSCNVPPNEVVKDDVPAALITSKSACLKNSSCSLKYAEGGSSLVWEGKRMNHTLSVGTHLLRSTSTASRLVSPLPGLGKVLSRPASISRE